MLKATICLYVAYFFIMLHQIYKDGGAVGVLMVIAGTFHGVGFINLIKEIL